jgi:hypothetical protein
VSFRWRDYRHHNKLKLMTLAADEFIRRFLLHTLPDGFHRHPPLRLSCQRSSRVEACAVPASLGGPAPAADYRERYRQLTGHSLDICPACGGRMELLGPPPRGAFHETSTRCDTS